MNKYFYHFTHLENLDSIIKNGLLCTNKKSELNISHYRISNNSIQERRSEMDVICDGVNFGKIHDFIPFYFSTRNPMQLSIINQKKVDQPELIFIGVETNLIKEKGFIFSSASANTVTPPVFYKDPIKLNQLDWGIINSKKWSYTPEEKHRKMAEVLIKDFDFSFIDHIVVFNEIYKDQAREILNNNNISQKLKILYQPVENNYFYFTKFNMKGRETENLVTGPKRMKDIFDSLNIEIPQKRKGITEFRCRDIYDLIIKLEEDFCYLDETAGIYNLETLNDVHKNSVSEHTLEVVDNLKKNKLFKNENTRYQEILILSAYLHDIGKGPHKKWEKGKQPSYPDHPHDSLIQTSRILIEDIERITDDEIRLINLLVGYHDILGDLSRDYRNTIELKNIIKSEKDLNLLYILSQADILSIQKSWFDQLNNNFEEIKRKVLK